MAVSAEVLGFIQLMDMLCNEGHDELRASAGSTSGREELCTKYGIEWKSEGDLGYDFVFCAVGDDFNGLIEEMTSCAKQALGYDAQTAKVTERASTTNLITTSIFNFLYQLSTDADLNAQFQELFPPEGDYSALSADQQAFLQKYIPGNPYDAWSALQQITATAGKNDQALAASMNQLAVDFYSVYGYS